jgi:hypothetical protein
MQKLGRAFLKRVKVSHFEQGLSAFYRERARAANGCVPRLLVSFVGRRFSVSPSSRDHRDEMLGGWGCRKRQLTYFIAARHQNRSCALHLFLSPLSAFCLTLQNADEQLFYLSRIHGIQNPY